MAIARVAVETIVGRTASPMRLIHAIPPSNPVMSSAPESEHLVKKTTVPTTRAYKVSREFDIEDMTLLRLMMTMNSAYTKADAIENHTPTGLIASEPDNLTSQVGIHQDYALANLKTIIGILWLRSCCCRCNLWGHLGTRCLLRKGHFPFQSAEIRYDCLLGHSSIVWLP